MSPSQSTDSLADNLTIYLITMTKLFIGELTGSVKDTSFLDCLLSQFSATLSFTSGHSTFSFCVKHVLKMGTKSQMAGIDAIRNIALVKYLKSIRDWAVVDFIRQAVGQVLSTAKSCKTSIALVIQAASPQPARLGFIDMSPEQGLKWYVWFSHAVQAPVLKGVVRLARYFHTGRAVTILAEVS